MGYTQEVVILNNVFVVNNQPAKWLVENSWGADKGKRGYLHLYDSWFDKYVYQIVIRKAYLPAKVLKILEEEPTVLPMWDPLAE